MFTTTCHIWVFLILSMYGETNHFCPRPWVCEAKAVQTYNMGHETELFNFALMVWTGDFFAWAACGSICRALHRQADGAIIGYYFVRKYNLQANQSNIEKYYHSQLKYWNDQFRCTLYYLVGYSLHIIVEALFLTLCNHPQVANTHFHTQHARAYARAHTDTQVNI